MPSAVFGGNVDNKINRWKHNPINWCRLGEVLAKTLPAAAQIIHTPPYHIILKKCEREQHTKCCSIWASAKVWSDNKYNKDCQKVSKMSAKKKEKGHKKQSKYLTGNSCWWKMFFMRGAIHIDDRVGGPPPPKTCLCVRVAIIGLETYKWLGRKQNRPMQKKLAATIVHAAAKQHRAQTTKTSGKISLKCKRLKQSSANDFPLKKQLTQPHPHPDNGAAEPNRRSAAANVNAVARNVSHNDLESHSVRVARLLTHF